MAMTGMGGPDNYNSWKFAGSTGSPSGPAGRTCNIDAEWECYEDCGACEDACWWTTCKDSVGQAVDMIDYVLDNFCIDLSRVWALGCSNGGMFLYELSHDPRTHNLLAGVVPMVGLPHYGYNFGPASPMHYMGFWGLHDGTVPPKASAATDGSFLPDRTSQESGWFF